MKTYSVSIISDGYVTCVAEDESRLTLPAAALPKGLKEGDILRFQDPDEAQTDPKATATKREQMLKRQKALMKRKSQKRR